MSVSGTGTQENASSTAGGARRGEERGAWRAVRSLVSADVMIASGSVMLGSLLRPRGGQVATRQDTWRGALAASSVAPLRTAAGAGSRDEAGGGAPRDARLRLVRQDGLDVQLHVLAAC